MSGHESFSGDKSHTRMQESSFFYGRPADFYTELLGVTKEELDGKTVLNIGAGGSHLQRDLGNDNIDTTVINIDMAYRSVIPRKSHDRHLVAADASMLPIGDNTVDIALALNLSINRQSSFERTLQEMIRVAREKVVIYPWLANPRELEKYISQNGLRENTTIDSPNPNYIRLLAANLKNEDRPTQKVTRGLKNTWYAYNEVVQQVLGPKRLTVVVK